MGPLLWEFRNTVNGRWYDIRDRAIRWVDGRLVRLEIATDVTDRKKAEWVLRESEEKYRLIFENAPLGIMHFDAAGICTACNDYFAGIIGAPKEEVVGFNTLCSLKDARMKEAVQKALSGGTGHFEGEYTSVTGKKTRVLRADYNPIMSADGTLFGGTGVFEDMTERKRLEDELSRAQRLEAAGRVAGQIAHDFNNLLSPLTAYPDLMRLECGEGDPILPLLDTMQTAAIQMADINQQLLTLGRRGHYNLEVLSVAHLLDRLLEAMVFPETVALEKAFEADLLPVKGGASQLDRAFTNLIANALEAMSDIGTLTVTARNVYLDVPLRKYETIHRGEYVKVEVADTGTGIAPQLLDRIFDPFFTTKKTDRKRGSGLGLSVVRAVTEDHDGYLDVASRSGQGTTFSLYFPITREPVSEPKDAAVGLPAGTEQILVADDDPFQRQVLTHLLTQLGYDVQTVESGEGAVAHVAENPQDLVILDMIMDGIDGAETYRRIKEICPEQKALLLSGYAESDRVAEAQRMGAGGFIRKPVGFQKIAVAVRHALDH
jgi:PAS domain S-box-containing protein